MGFKFGKSGEYEQMNIREVARLAGVSPVTVSRVINGTASVSEDKRARVLRAIAETEFVPNEVARTLFKGSSKTIGLLIPSMHKLNNVNSIYRIRER